MNFQDTENWQNRTLRAISLSGAAGVDILDLRNAEPLAGANDWPAYDAALTRLATRVQRSPLDITFRRGRVMMTALVLAA